MQTNSNHLYNKNLLTRNVTRFFLGQVCSDIKTSNFKPPLKTATYQARKPAFLADKKKETKTMIANLNY